MALDPGELQNVVRVMMLAQLALPSVFVAGLIAASGAARGTIARIVAQLKDEDADVDEEAVLNDALRAERIRILGFVLAVLLFLAGSAVPVLYVTEAKAEKDSLAGFLTFQTGLFILSWAVATGFAFFVAPRDD